MAKVYFDPDNDELVSTKTLSPKQKAALKKLLEQDDEFDDTYETQSRLEDIEDAIRENTDAVRENTLAAERRHQENRDSVATGIGFVVGYKLMDSIADTISDLFSAPFSSSKCECKKKWF